MRKLIDIPPPSNFETFSPSELFRFFFQLGRWTDESFSDTFQSFNRGKLVSTVTISKWKNRDVVPSRYSGQLLKLIENSVIPALASDWVQAFETVWAHQSAGRLSRNSAQSSSSFSNEICLQHKKWIEDLYRSKENKDSATIEELYVPLQFYDATAEVPAPLDIEDILETSQNANWTLISGKAGTGKSVSAKHMAYILSQGRSFPILIRCDRFSDIAIDMTETRQPIGDTFSFKSYLKHFRASSFDTAFLILDGLDKISFETQPNSRSKPQLFSDLRAEQSACAAHGKRLIVLIFGRDSSVISATHSVKQDPFTHFKLLCLDGSFPLNGNEDEGLVLGEDLRELWWEKYLAAHGYYPDPTLPDFLTTSYDDFFEFGENPLLAALICEMALIKSPDGSAETLPHERVNNLTRATNKNKIYESLFQHIASQISFRLPPNHFKKVLQHLAVSAWQNLRDGAVSLEAVYSATDDEDIRSGLKALGLSPTSATEPADILMTALYSRQHRDKQSDQKEIIFTDRAFAEYLVCTRLFDLFESLLRSFDDPDIFEPALNLWFQAASRIRQEPSLAVFCQKEAALRYEFLSVINWDNALKIIKDRIRSSLFEKRLDASIPHLQNSASLLFFIWSCFNLERQKLTNDPFEMSEDNTPFDIIDFRSIQKPNGLDMKTGSQLEPVLRDHTFLTQSLSGLKLKACDLSQLSFSLGDMENITTQGTNFAMTHWSHVKTRNAHFTKTLFQQALFHQWRVINSGFVQCLFQGVRFQGGDFSKCQFRDSSFSLCYFSEVDFTSSDWSGVVFDRCVFVDCQFDSQNSDPDLKPIDFRFCTFLDGAQIMTSGSENFAFPTGLNELL